MDLDGIFVVLDEVFLMNQSTSAKQSILRARTPNSGIEDEARAEGFTPLQARILASRLHDSALGRVATFAQPRLADLDKPWSLPDIDIAVDTIIDVIRNPQMKLICVTDHDADGVDSLAVLVSSFVDFLGVDKARVIPFLSHRLKEGYGVSDKVVDRLIEACPEPALIITADQGSTDEQRFARLVELGYSVIVTDHHEIPEQGPPQSAIACVNPTRSDSQYPDRYIAGCYVAWLLMAAVRARMIERGHLPRSTPSLTSLLDYVAIGTTADASSFARSINNRAVVRNGIDQINRAARPAWRAMRAIIKKTADIDSRDLAMAFAPRLNARGRLGDMMLGAEFLLSTNIDDAIRLASVLDEENNRRKEIEKAMTQAGLGEAIAQQSKAAIVVYLREGHPGVHGIVASRYVSMFGRPVVCLSPKEDAPGVLTGSLRGVPGTNVRDALAAVKSRLGSAPISFGGHAAASGCLVKEMDVEAFREAFQQAIADQVQDIDSLVPVQWHDGPLGEEPSAELLCEIDEIGPYGREFELPTFIGSFFVKFTKTVGDGSHLHLTLQAESGQTFGAIWFNAMPQGEVPPVQPGEHAQFHYAMSWNDFRGLRTLNLVVKGLGS